MAYELLIRKVITVKKLFMHYAGVSYLLFNEANYLYAKCLLFIGCDNEEIVEIMQ